MNVIARKAVVGERASPRSANHIVSSSKELNSELTKNQFVLETFPDTNRKEDEPSSALPRSLVLNT
jgi:hypothetical protein